MAIYVTTKRDSTTSGKLCRLDETEKAFDGIKIITTNMLDKTLYLVEAVAVVRPLRDTTGGLAFKG